MCHIPAGNVCYCDKANLTRVANVLTLHIKPSPRSCLGSNSICHINFRLALEVDCSIMAVNVTPTLQTLTHTGTQLTYTHTGPFNLRLQAQASDSEWSIRAAATMNYHEVSLTVRLISPRQHFFSLTMNICTQVTVWIIHTLKVRDVSARRGDVFQSCKSVIWARGYVNAQVQSQ